MIVKLILVLLACGLVGLAIHFQPKVEAWWDKHLPYKGGD